MKSTYNNLISYSIILICCLILSSIVVLYDINEKITFVELIHILAEKSNLASFAIQTSMVFGSVFFFKFLPKQLPLRHLTSIIFGSL